MFDRADWGKTKDAELCDSLLTEGAMGMVAGTKVATPQGWRKVEAICEGDLVLTFDGGMQQVIDVRRQIVWTADHLSSVDSWPLAIPAGALGNKDVMVLLPNQAVMIESDAAEEAFGDPFALIPASVLNGFRGIAPMAPPVRIEIVNLYFARDEIVFANIGALYHCPRSVDILSDQAMDAVYDVLSIDLADHLIGLLEIEDEAKGRAVVVTRAQSAVA